LTALGSPNVIGVKVGTDIAVASPNVAQLSERGRLSDRTERQAWEGVATPSWCADPPINGNPRYGRVMPSTSSASSS